MLFGKDSAGGISFGRLVKTPLNKYAHLTGRDGYLTNHLSTVSHTDCVTKASAFTAAQHKSGDICTQLNTEFSRQRDHNRNVLHRILKAIEFHGRLGLALRGHDDSGPLKVQTDNEDTIDYNEGNLRALLQLMMNCNDNTLKSHFANTVKMPHLFRHYLGMR